MNPGQLGCKRGGAGAIGDLDRHDFDGPICSGDACCIVPHRTEEARTHRAVAIVVHGIRGTRDRIDSKDIIDVAIPVVINSVTGDLVGISPHVGGEIGMGVIHASVEQRYDCADGSCSGVPR